MIFFILTRLKVTFWTLFYRILGRLAFAKMGVGCVFEGWIDIPQRGGRIELGDGVRIASLTEFSVLKGALLKIGDRSFIGRGTLISAHKQVEIGNDVLLAEFCALHDNNHAFRDMTQPIARQGTHAQHVIVGENVWIGAQCVLLSGVHIPSGCVVGASAVVHHSLKIRENTIIAGTPAKQVGARHQDQ
ncbi:DapH/DapD/GlmU-related protein [uncultured Erythrobacter sp.]|uniref:acyltransferase n=1 Tax=uncultured Erythrobacter sp. TaxID=263913 RepID=UPI0026592335|nr:acyltransferase [uncultured Erythrobacter sp.]